ncbi:glycosyltransferase family 4 protein [Corynebacterium halotolerans]|uniref:Colanic acid biosynthesis glycosyl transferase wcaI n=1 Tax=Corynebacterium halotolerans YIM 70093 = DSM 44683 TaxID=1121362 RepID=M1NZX7_9CORY|nr:glycosyltransferase family 4 protein [Corynebacterium halotolerans]AGF73055.1 colanic acid biosynthesis glycosyl transferase wcaI [Corynebacterium halotolerans YIM 70093 = DSM 44683]
MKILILSQYWHPENGVPQRRWTWLSRILVDAGHEVTVIAPPPHYQRKVELRQWWSERQYSSSFESDPGPSGERIIRSGFVPSGASLTQRIMNQATVALGALWVVLKRPGVLKGYRPDLVIGTVPALPTAVVAGLSARILKCPYVIDLRDAWPDLLDQSEEWNKSTGKRSLRERILTKGPFQVLSAGTRLALHKVLKGAAGLSVTSSHLQCDLCERPEIQTRGNAPKIVTVRNVFPPETDYRAEQVDEGPCGELKVLYAGTLGRAQNLANAVEAARLAEEAGVRIHLRLVGAGAAREALTETARATDTNVSIEGRQPADKLDDYYEWADTALVHLTDWEPLKRAVPSKTYELMVARLHISGVVKGEAADIIRSRRAGDVVPPDDPRALADLWIALARDRSRLTITGDGPEWVKQEREEIAPPRLLELVEEVGGR